MHQSHILSTLVVSLILGTPACGSKFVSLGDEDAGFGAGGGSETVGGGSPTVGGAGSLPNGAGGLNGAGGAMPTTGGNVAVAAGGSAGCVCGGPAPKMMNYLCSDGSLAGPVCEPNANGMCAWDIRDCPVEASGGSYNGAGGGMPVGAGGSNGIGGGMPVGAGGSNGIGGGMPVGAGGSNGIGGGMPVGAGGSAGCVCTDPAPESMNYVCWDGSIAGPTCEPNANGVCSWDIRGCPVQGSGGASAGAGGAFAGVGGAGAAGGGAARVECRFNGVLYAEGQSFPEGDGCNTCYCMAAGVACTAMACPLPPLGTGGGAVQ